VTSPTLRGTAPDPFPQAALCALRVVRKVPELTDHFTAKAKNLLADRNHGVLLSSITLMIEMCQADHNVLNEFRNVRYPHSEKWP